MVHRPGPRAAVVAAALLGAAALGGCGSDGTESGAEQETGAPTTAAEPAELKGVVRSDPLQVADVVLPDVSVTPEADFAFRAEPGGLLVVFFGYTSCPDICPTTLAAIKAAEEALPDSQAERVTVAMVTVDPERDVPEKMTGYIESFTDQYHALRTTDWDRLRAAEATFAAESRIETLPDGTVEVAHTGTVYVVDEAGQVVVEWPFGFTPVDMTGDLAFLFRTHVDASAAEGAAEGGAGAGGAGAGGA